MRNFHCHRAVFSATLSCAAPALEDYRRLGLDIAFCLPTNMSVLSKLPQKLSSPFALLGDEVKLAFRSQPSGISKLASIRVRQFVASREMIDKQAHAGSNRSAYSRE